MSKQLNKIYQPYFDYLEKMFGDLAHEAITNNVAPDVIAKDYLSNGERRKKVNEYLLPEVFKSVILFWDNNKETVQKYIDNLPSLKANFGGDIGPQISDKIFQRAGLYFDTIIVPDPLLWISSFPTGEMKQVDYYLLKYGISLVILKEIYLADVFPPIAVLSGEGRTTEKSQHIEDLKSLSRLDSILFINELFNKSFDTFQQTQVFINKFKDINNIVKEIQKPELIYFDEYSIRDPFNQIDSFLEKASKDLKFDKYNIANNSSIILYFAIFGRFMQINDLLRYSSKIDSNPMISAEVSFHWLQCKLSLNQQVIEKSIPDKFKCDLALTNSLLSKKLMWLGNVPIDSIITLRKQGLLNDLRKDLNSGISQLSSSGVRDNEKISSQVDYNISVLIERHQEKIKEIDRELRYNLKISVPTLLISIAATIQPLMPAFLPQWIQYIGGVTGMSSISSMINSFVDYIQKRKNLSGSSVGILWQAKKEKPISNEE